MVNVVKNNRAYFFCLSLLVVLGGMYLLWAGKSDAILFFSSHRYPFVDVFFKTATRLAEGPAYIVVGLLALGFHYRYGIAVGVTGFTVMGLSYLLKSFFAQDRPLAFFEKTNFGTPINYVAGVEVHSGATSFPSGHAMSAFALFGLLAFLLPEKKRYALSLFAIALLVALSRVYLVQHFWEDVYAGAILGTVVAMSVYVLQERYWVKTSMPSSVGR